jgi:CHAD domain-containing protein
VRTGHPAAEPAAARAGAAPRLKSPERGPVLVATLLAELGTRFGNSLGRCRTGNDDDALHDARVSARRLESALTLWRDALDPGARQRTLRGLRRWRRRLSSTRDLEVMTEALAEHGLATTAAGAAQIARLRAAVALRRDRARRRIAARLTPARLARMSARLERTLASLTPAPGAMDAASARCAQAERAAGAAIAAVWEQDDDHTLHEARLAVKKHRYAAEALALVAGRAPASASASAHALQRALGLVHDRAQVRDLLQRSARRALARKHPRRASALASAAVRAEQLRLEAIALFRALRPATPSAG